MFSKSNLSLSDIDKNGNNPLHRACMAGDNHQVSRLVISNNDESIRQAVQKENFSGQKPLDLVRAGKNELLKTSDKNNCKANWYDR